MRVLKQNQKKEEPICDDFFDDFDDFEDDGPMEDEPFEDDPEPLDDPIESFADPARPDWSCIAFFGAMSETLDEERWIQRHLEKDEQNKNEEDL
ncbi:MAG: hypothetical protein K9K88_00565 [Desulfobacterales bacterium]|nr:hypothetical protein [Desulfobacterales bacterium]